MVSTGCDNLLPEEYFRVCWMRSIDFYCYVSEKEKIQFVCIMRCRPRLKGEGLNYSNKMVNYD